MSTESLPVKFQYSDGRQEIIDVHLDEKVESLCIKLQVRGDVRVCSVEVSQCLLADSYLWFACLPSEETQTSSLELNGQLLDKAVTIGSLGVGEDLGQLPCVLPFLALLPLVSCNSDSRWAHNTGFITK
jgi:hypothetical protein